MHQDKIGCIKLKESAFLLVYKGTVMSSYVYQHKNNQNLFFNFFNPFLRKILNFYFLSQKEM